jgi:autotransporter-associated beta strand protein
MGSGTFWQFDNHFDGNNNWWGAKANAMVAQFDGDGQVLHKSGVHFYGYGLNYDTEVVNDSVYMRNIAIMYAMRQDMGNGMAADPWSATSVTLTKSDDAGTSAFNWFGGGFSGSYGGWSDRYFAHKGAAYSSGNFVLRTPLDTGNPGGATPSFTFAGGSLTINNTNGNAGGLWYQGHGTGGVVTIGALNLNSGYVRHMSGAADLFQLAGNVALSGNSTIDADQGSIKILSKISGAGALTIEGANSTILTGANTYSGGTTLAAGTLRVGSNSALGTGGVALSGGTLSSDNNSFANTEPTMGNAVTVASSSSIAGGVGTLFRMNGQISGNAPLRLNAVFNGSGLRLGGNNSGYTGTATVAGSNVRLGAASAGSAAAAWVVNGNLQTDVTGGATFELGSLSGAGTISGHAANASRAVSVLRVGALNSFGRELYGQSCGWIVGAGADDDHR